MTSKADSVAVLRNTLATMARMSKQADLPVLAFLLAMAELEAAIAQMTYREEAKAKP